MTGGEDRNLTFERAAPIVRTEFDDGAVKFIQRLNDGLESESVVLSYRSRSGKVRRTLCVSSQIGCAMGCTFCETGRMGFLRNLTAREIVGQWIAARESIGRTIDNIVFMGMGEPLENLDAVVESIQWLTDRNGGNLPSRKTAVSTVGRARAIRTFARQIQSGMIGPIRLAVSLNAPNDEIRQRIMPINRAEPITEIFDALKCWPLRPRDHFLFEYVLIPDVNDQDEHALELAHLISNMPCKLNVIPYNPIRNSPWPAPTEASIDAFLAIVRRGGCRASRRRTIGRSAFGACGQLGNAAIRREGIASMRVPPAKTDFGCAQS